MNKVKKIIMLLIASMVLFSSVPSVAFGGNTGGVQGASVQPYATVVDSGTCGPSLNWSFDDEGVLTISGTGAMNDYVGPGTTPWYSHRLNIDKVVVEDGATILGYSAFEDCSNLETVDLSGCSTLTAINPRAFYACASLSSMDLSGQVGLTTIENVAFGSCINLTRVDFPSTLASIGALSFTACNNLKVLVFNGNIAPTIDSTTFMGISSTGTLYYPLGASSSYSAGVFGAPYLDGWTFTDFALPVLTENSVTRNNDILVDINISSTKDGTYYYIAQPEGGTPPTAADIISGGVSGSISANTPMTVSVTTTQGAWDVYIVVVTPGGVLESNVLEVTVPKWNPSGYCGSPTLMDIEWVLDRETGVITFTGSGDMESYMYTVAPWYSYNNTIQEASIGAGITSLGEYAFDGCSQLDTINFPTTLNEIGEGVFRGCNGFTSMTLPAHITYMGDYVFTDAKGLESVDLSATPFAVLPRSTFSGCNLLKEVALPDTISLLNDRAFKDCIALESIDLSSLSLLTHIGEEVFEDCTALKSVVLPASLSDIDDNAFLGCSSLDTLNFKGAVAPTLVNTPFAGVPIVGNIYYPQGASGYVQGVFGTPDLDGWFFRSTPAILTPGTVTRISETDATVTFTSDEDITYYYEMVPANAPAPVINTSGAGVAGVKNVLETISVNSLSPGTAVDIYIIGKDGLGNLSNQVKLAIPAIKYTITIINGSGSGSYASGETVTVTADTAPAGQVFSQWKSSSSSVVFAEASNPTTTFVAPMENVTVTAEYKAKSSGNNGGNGSSNSTGKGKTVFYLPKTGNSIHSIGATLVLTTGAFMIGMILWNKGQRQNK